MQTIPHPEHPRPDLRREPWCSLYDTCQEENGLLTFDRQPKLPPEALRAFSESLRPE